MPCAKLKLTWAFPFASKGFPICYGRDIGPGHPYHAIGEIDYPAPMVAARKA